LPIFFLISFFALFSLFFSSSLNIHYHSLPVTATSYDGKALQCGAQYDCGTQCTKNGFYCGPDPDSDLGAGVRYEYILPLLKLILLTFSLFKPSLHFFPSAELTSLWRIYVNFVYGTRSRRELMLVQQRGRS
jgi:hypothetical protein